MLRVDFPFRVFVNRLEQPHCLRNMRVSGARSKHTATAALRQNRSEADFSAAVTQQTHFRTTTQTVCPNPHSRRFLGGSAFKSPNPRDCHIRFGTAQRISSASGRCRKFYCQSADPERTHVGSADADAPLL